MPERSLTIEGFSNIKIQLEPMNVRAQGGKEYPFLIVPIRLDINSIEYPRGEVPNFAILNVQSTLYVESRSRRLADSIILYRPVYFKNNRPAGANYSIEFPLDFHRVKVIEEIRRGDMRLGLDFRFLVGFYRTLSIRHEGEPEGKQDSIDFIVRYSTESENFDFEIPQSYWVSKVLPSFGDGDYFIVEIPKGDKTLQDAWIYLGKAENAFNNWNSKEVFGNCREIGSLLDRHIRAKFGTNTFSYKERWGRSYGKFESLASLDLHLEDLKKSSSYPPDVIKTNKIDAEHLILRTKALIKYAEELLKE